MTKSITITKEVIIETAFEMARKEGFSALSARSIARKIGCSTQPIYWTYKNMEDLKKDVCQKSLRYLREKMYEYRKTGNSFLDLGLGYVRMAHTEPALFKAFYMDNIMKIQMNDVVPESQIVEIMQNSEEYHQMTVAGVKEIAAKAWMLAHGIASLVTAGMLVYDEEKIIRILE